MAATPMVKVIYGKPMVPDLARVLACLYEKNIAFELEDMNRGVRMPKDLLNLQISSHEHTPVLIDDPNELFGSRKICRHIVEKYGASGYQYLLGKDPLARASVEQWIQSEVQRFDPPSSTLVFYLAFKIEADVEMKSQSEKKLVKVLNLYEQRLGESDFLAENYFTLADLYHLPNTYYLERSEEYGHLFKDRKNVSRWWKNISERDSWKNVVKKFEEKGLHSFGVLVSNNETTQSTSYPRKNDIRSGPMAGLESSSKKQGANADIREVKIATDASGKKKEATLSEEKKDDKAVQSKAENKKEETEDKEHDTKDKKETLNSDDKDKSSTAEKGNSGKTDEVKEQDAKKPAPEDKKEEPKRADKDKSSSLDKSKSNATNETKDADANKPASKGEKDANQPFDKDKSSSSDNNKTGKTSEDANKPRSENKEMPQQNDKDKASSGGKEEPVNIDDKKVDKGEKDAQKPNGKDKDQSGKTEEGKIDGNEEHKTKDLESGGKKDGFKSEDKDLSDKQAKKDSEPNDGEDKTSPAGNKNPNPKVEKEKTS